MYKLDYTLSGGASTQGTAFLAKYFSRRFLENITKFSIIPNYIPLEENTTLYFHKLESPLPNDAL